MEFDSQVSQYKTIITKSSAVVLTCTPFKSPYLLNWHNTIAHDRKLNGNVFGRSVLAKLCMWRVQQNALFVLERNGNIQKQLSRFASVWNNLRVSVCRETGACWRVFSTRFERNHTDSRHCPCWQWRECATYNLSTVTNRQRQFEKYFCGNPIPCKVSSKLLVFIMTHTSLTDHLTIAETYRPIMKLYSQRYVIYMYSYLLRQLREQYIVH